MEVWDALRTRLTVRQFKPDPVPDEVVTKLLQVGLWSPSSRNRQPWHFIVIRDRETLRKIGGITTYGSFLADAPIAIAIGMDRADGGQARSRQRTGTPADGGAGMVGGHGDVFRGVP